MWFRLFIVSLLVFSIFAFSFTQSELTMLRYQLQMPPVVGNSFGLRTVGTLDEGAFGLVWKYDTNFSMFSGQILAFNSVFSNWLETGVFEWQKLYFDIFLLFRF
jgi:hypothetical protein